MARGSVVTLCALVQWSERNRAPTFSRRISQRAKSFASCFEGVDTRQHLPTKQLDRAAFVLSRDLRRTEHKVDHAYSGERLEDPETLDDGVRAARTLRGD